MAAPPQKKPGGQKTTLAPALNLHRAAHLAKIRQSSGGKQANPSDCVAISMASSASNNPLRMISDHTSAPPSASVGIT